MRRAFLPSAVLAASMTIANGARAQMAVVDAPATAQLIQQVSAAANQLRTLQQQYNQLVSTYQQITNQYNMLTRFADPNGAARELEQPFLRNPLPTTAALPSALTGVGGVGGTSYAPQYLSSNQVYAPPTTTQGGQLMNTQAASLATIQGTATTNLSSIEQRITGLSDLQGQLDSATTIQQVSSVNARIAAENTYLSAQQAQATNLQTITAAQIATQQQQQQQMVSQQAQQASAAFPVSVP